MPRAYIFKEITDIESAKRFLAELVADHADFHLDDDPADIVDGKTGRGLFSDLEIIAMRARQGELYALDWENADYECPITFMLMAIDARDASSPN